MAASILSRRLLLAFCTTCLMAAPAFAETVRGNGVIKSQARDVSGFTGVGLGIAGKVDVKLGPTDSVTVEADENLLPLIETSVRNGMLEIKAARHNLNLESRSVHVIVQAKAIDDLAIGGSGTITAEPLRTSKMKLEIGGSGSIDVKRLDADKVEIEIGGSGKVSIAGAAKSVDASIGGSGDVIAPNFVVDSAEVTVAGSGDAKLAVRSKLDVTIAGVGAIGYYGDPQVSRTIVGSGSIRRLGGLPQQP